MKSPRTARKSQKIDRFFLITLLLIVALGIVMFISASLGLLVKSPSIFYSVLFNQLVLGLGLGLIGMYVCYRIDYKFWRTYSLYLLIGSVVLTLLVFIPGLGSNHGTGATRWLSLHFFSFQPVEFLKFGFIIYFAAWLSWAKNRVQDFKYSMLPLGILLALIAVILFKQPDTKSFILISVTGMSMLFISGVPIRYILGVGLGAVVVLSLLVYSTPYLQARVKTFMDPSNDPRGSSFQIQQSLIALGGGGVFGRGLGQSIQKFSYLPEPQGDSIFAVLGEELGLFGALATIILYVIFTLRGFRIANKTPDLFSRLLVSGIVILIIMQSFMHIASVTGVFPLTGVPLPFMSHGGTSLMIYLSAMGILLQISKLQHRNT
ncbi:MAG TPA: putative lipid II flippase FtsW [Candidatus Paceibacterota bacterium]|jgi:cell division protein FtsW|nr:putative lipid II flippase FtsW [Candidatus Paceibacterota bacterium]